MDISFITLFTKDVNIRGSVLIYFADRVKMPESELIDSLK